MKERSHIEEPIPIERAALSEAIQHLEAIRDHHCCMVGPRGECHTRKHAVAALAALQGEA